MLNNLKKSKRLDLIISLLITAIVALTRIPFVSKFLYDWDSASYGQAFQNFNIAQGQPQPPGYILFIALGKVVNYIFNDPNTSMVFLSVAFSILTAVLIYFFVKQIFSRRIALITSILLIFNPLFWFYGFNSLSIL
jgi:4-amino-4-deoxy-L-arabinose transferase-like glycosyltransferase